ncbi:MAG TPA: ABC transporter permease [Dongiaceae bacterium]
MNLALPIGRRSATLYHGVLIVLVWVILALGASAIAPYDPTVGNDLLAMQGPSALHWFGCDNQGRDILSRLLYGARTDITMAALAIFPPFVIGCGIGLVAGYFGGVSDYLPIRLLDVTGSFPYFILILAVISVVGPGQPGFYISVAAVGWVGYARILRNQTRSLRQGEFVTAARCLGFSGPRILLLHILPNALLPAAIQAISDIALTLMLAVALNYLGLGVQAPAIEWGRMISEGQAYLAPDPWICFFPGAAIMLLALGFRLAADGLAERLEGEG